MSDLRAREASSGEWDGPVVELIEESRVVGLVYQDGATLFAEFTPDAEGESWAFEVADLQTALDTAAAILLPEGTSLLVDEPSVDDDAEHPVDKLAEEFDELAAHRGEEDEGFFPPGVAAQIVRHCESTGLAVVSVEGFRHYGDWVDPVAGLAVDIGRAHDGEPWPVFLAGCNVQAMAVLERWAREPDLVLALEVGDSDGDRYVL